MLALSLVTAACSRGWGHEWHFTGHDCVLAELETVLSIGRSPYRMCSESPVSGSGWKLNHRQTGLRLSLGPPGAYRSGVETGIINEAESGLPGKRWAIILCPEVSSTTRPHPTPTPTALSEGLGIRLWKLVFVQCSLWVRRCAEHFPHIFIIHHAGAPL